MILATMNSMKRVGWCIVLLAGLAFRLPAASSDASDFKEVYDLLRSHLSGTDDKALNRAAVEGLVKQLYPKVTLLKDSDVNSTKGWSGATSLLKADVIDGAFGYFRVGQVSGSLAKDFAEAYQKMSATNRLKGVALDLRFAGGQDYGAALATADCFFADEQPLIDWGDGMKKSTAKEKAIRVPLMVLVNAKTAAAAEALAGALRQSDVGLLIGTTTAGEASKFKEFPLKSGERLRIATSPVKVGRGESLPLTGLKPDIQVEVSLEDEQAYWEDAYKILPVGSRAARKDGAATNETSVTGTNRPGRRLTEAELVRMHREGRTLDLEGTNTARRTGEPGQPVLQDPVLVRAIDVLKGLAVVQPFRARSD